MKFPFELSPNFKVKRERTIWNIETRMAKVYNLSPDRAAFIKAILVPVSRASRTASPHPEEARRTVSKGEGGLD